MFIVEKKQNEIYSLHAAELDINNTGALKSALSHRILNLLVQRPMYPKEISKALRVHEQKIYYHIRNLGRAGVIKVIKKETRQGAVANFYTPSEHAFVIKLKNLELTNKIAQVKNESAFLEPFVKDGQLDAFFVVGSPDPHGAEKARSRDAYYGIDLALFLGTFLNYVPQFKTKLDTEIRKDDLENNLILIGGPLINKVVEKVNSNLPIKFEKGIIKSTISNKIYSQDECGLIVKTKNPFNKNKSILVVAGKRYSGTRASVIAFLRNFKEIAKGNSYDNDIKAKVVEGIDLDYDGIVDDVEFRE